ncbi:hypothetical protein A5848_001336, partial [Enterococcus faecium]
FYIRIRIESLACLKRKRLKMQQISADL